MTRAALLNLLEALGPPTAASCLALLWTYYEPRLGEVENGLRRANVHPLRLAADPDAGAALMPTALAARLRRLRGLVGDAPGFDQSALSLIKGLDRALHRVATVVGGVEHRGADGERYRLWSQNNFIADTCDPRGNEVTWAAHQGRSMTAYARHFLVLPVGAPTAKRVESRRLRDDHRYLDSRLLAERDRQRFTIMLWPLAVRIDYPALDGLDDAPAFVSLNDPRNEDAVRLDVEQAIDEARRREATVLLLPELAVSPTVVKAARQRLGQAGQAGYPLLTVLGLCHSRCTDPGMTADTDVDVNEAILLGPDGAEVHRHRKIEPFSIGGAHACGERIQTGDRVTVLESAIGNLAILICLDLFHDEMREVLARSHANVLLVPSLSPSTTAHRTRATDLGAARLMSTFVTNRWLVDAPTPAARLERASFYRVPRRRQGEMLHATVTDSYLLFEL